MIHKFNLPTDFINKAVSAIERFVIECKRTPIRIALSGGSSPKAVYEKLAESKLIDWSKVEVYQVDERYAPVNSDGSNAKMIQGSLTSKLPNLKAFHAFDTTKPIQETLDEYQKKLDKLSKPLFNLVLLGLGADGHTASLFPHGPELEETENWVVNSQSPTGIRQRLSLSLPAIMNSQKIIFLIRGAEKKEIVEKWLNDEGVSEEELPAKIILDHPDVDVYYDYS